MLRARSSLNVDASRYDALKREGIAVASRGWVKAHVADVGLQQLRDVRLPVFLEANDDSWGDRVESKGEHLRRLLGLDELERTTGAPVDFDVMKVVKSNDGEVSVTFQSPK